jgi:hypothetical protein
VTHDDLPWLRGALVRMAHEEPVLAGRLLVGLLPAQSALLDEALEYDLTVRGLGTFAVTVGEQGATVVPIARRRSRRARDFHLSAEPAALAEMLAGRERPVGRFTRGARVRGRRGERVEVLRQAARGRLDLAAAARAGARLDPEPVLHAFAYVIHPGWTRGHRFTVAQEVVGEGCWYVAVADGAPIRVSGDAPPAGATATVSMSRATFDALLRREPSPAGERPKIRGDRTAVELLRAWTDRARALR